MKMMIGPVTGFSMNSSTVPRAELHVCQSRKVARQSSKRVSAKQSRRSLR